MFMEMENKLSSDEILNTQGILWIPANSVLYKKKARAALNVQSRLSVCVPHAAERQLPGNVGVLAELLLTTLTWIIVKCDKYVMC